MLPIHTAHTQTTCSCPGGRDMGNDNDIANVTHGPGSTQETFQIIDVNSSSSPVRPASARFRGAGGGTGVGGLVRDSSVSVGPRVHSLSFLSPPMPASPPLAAEGSSYYSNHYNRRWDAWRGIRLKTLTEVNNWGREKGKANKGFFRFS